MTEAQRPLGPDAFRDIIGAIARGDPQFVIDALHHLPDGASPKRLMRLGFEVLSTSGVRLSFAAHCAAADQLGVLEHFVEHNGLGITLRDCCTKKSYGGLAAVERYESLAFMSVENSWPKGLRFALHMEPQHPDLHALSKATVGEATLLFKATSKAIHFGSDADLECARILLQHGAPIRSTAYPNTPGASCLFQISWRPEMMQGLSALMVDFTRAGLIDLNAHVERDAKKRFHGRTPLGLAIHLGLPQAARELVLLGSSTDGAIHPGCTDIIASVDACELDREVKLHMVACLREAIMHRQIDSYAFAAESAANVTAAAQRNARGARL